MQNFYVILADSPPVPKSKVLGLKVLSVEY